MSFGSEENYGFKGLNDRFRSGPPGGDRVLLREPEVCRQCARTFISLYPLGLCADHDGLDEI